MGDYDFDSRFQCVALEVLTDPSGRENNMAVEGGSLEFGEEMSEGWFGQPTAER